MQISISCVSCSQQKLSKDMLSLEWVDLTANKLTANISVTELLSLPNLFCQILDHNVCHGD